MIVAMAHDVRVILIKLADRLHNMRTSEYWGKQTQIRKAKETLEVYAPLAHRLGIHALKWELEDLSFQILHPRKYAEIKAMVADRRADRESQVDQAATILGLELEKADIPALISGRAKHFYSIYDKMAKKGREFNEIYDLTAMRVIAERSGEEGTRDCYGALGLIHSLWKPMPGRFKDFIAMPKLNRYRSLHTTVIGPSGTPLEIQVRTREMHEEAELGVAAHWLYKRGKAAKGDDEWLTWVRSLMDWQGDEQDAVRVHADAAHRSLRRRGVRLHAEGRGEDAAGRGEPIDFAYAVHTDVGHRTVGAKVNGRIVPLHYHLKNGDFVEILTSKSGRGPSRDWLSVAAILTRPQQDPAVVPARDPRRDRAEGPRRARPGAQGAEPAVPQAPGLERPRLGDPRPRASRRRRTSTSRSARGRSAPARSSTRCCSGSRSTTSPEEPVVHAKPAARKRIVSGDSLGVVVPGVDDVLVRLAKCCTPVPGDQIRGYISLGRGITIHRADCPNVKALMRNPERFTPVEWEGDTTSSSFRVQIAVDGWDRARLLEDVARTFSEHGANIVAYGGTVEDGMARNWYTAELGDVKALRSLLGALRNLDAVFDAYRMTPGG